MDTQQGSLTSSSRYKVNRKVPSMDPGGIPQHIFSGLAVTLNPKQFKMNRAMRRHDLLSIVYKLLHFYKSLNRKTAETEVYMYFLPTRNWKGVLYLNTTFCVLGLSYFFVNVIVSHIVV